MKPNQHFIAVSTDEELPPKKGQYHTNMGLLNFRKHDINLSHYTEWSWDYNGGGGYFIDSKEISYWLRPIDPPTEEEIEVNAVEFANRGQFMSNFPHHWSSSHEGYIEGAKAIIALMKGEKP